MNADACSLPSLGKSLIQSPAFAGRANQIVLLSFTSVTKNSRPGLSTRRSLATARVEPEVVQQGWLAVARQTFEPGLRAQGAI
jgi:hypothetical protein